MELRSFRIVTYLGLAFLLLMKPASCSGPALKQLFGIHEMTSSISTPVHPRPTKVLEQQPSEPTPVIHLDEQSSEPAPVIHTLKKIAPTYRVVSKAIVEDPHQPIGIIHILISGDMSDSALRKILAAHYYSFIETQGARDTDFAGHVEIYAFDEVEKTGRLWIGRLRKHPQKVNPVIHIKKSNFSSV